jgi:hypothetical protein
MEKLFAVENSVFRIYENLAFLSVRNRVPEEIDFFDWVIVCLGAFLAARLVSCLGFRAADFAHVANCILPTACLSSRIACGCFLLVST